MTRFFTTTILLLCTLLTNAQSDTLNQTDPQGRKQGYWIYLGKDMPRKQYPSDSKISEGPFKDDRKNGLWIMYYKSGAIRTEGNFVDGKPNGAYVKRHESGGIREKGNYHDRKQTGYFETRNEDGIITQKKTLNKDGKAEGLVEFFYDDGTPQKTVNMVNGVPTGESITYYPNGDVKSVVVFGDDGEVVSKEQKERVNPPKGEEKAGSGGPPGDKGVRKDGKPFVRDGYNKLYNDQDEIWMDGQFKGGKLWDGELYKYDSDGILLKIEIWKNGKYHSDGHLK